MLEKGKLFKTKLEILAAASPAHVEATCEAVMFMTASEIRTSPTSLCWFGKQGVRGILKSIKK